MAISLQITDRASPTLAALAAQLGPSRTGPVAGRAVVNLVRRHLFARDRSDPNALGGKRTHFWAAAARSTTMEPAPYGALVSINQLGFRLQYQGGTIRPVNRRYLTIPARAEAHGMRAREFDDLSVLYGRGGQPKALVRSARTEIQVGKKGVRRGQTTGGEVMYWLVKEANIPAHPDVLPTEPEMAEAARAALASFYARQMARSR